MTERVKKLVDFFKENPNEVPGCGIFDCRNMTGDPMATIYDEPADGVVVDACYGYDYIEIFGLTDEEFRDAEREITNLYTDLYVDPFTGAKEYRWKPTKKQIDALDAVYKTHYMSPTDKSTILDLLNDLKKLM